MNALFSSSPWRSLQAQWQGSPLLRIGALAMAALLAVQLLLLGLDHADVRQQELLRLKATEQRLQDLQRETAWASRAADAQGALAAYQTMAWTERDVGLSEAALQDWLRSTTARLGLTVQELKTGRVEALAGADPATPAARRSAPLPAGHVQIQARLILELQRAPVLAFLAEVQRSERSLVVERLVWRGASQPPIVEIELRALARAAEGTQR